MQQLNQILPAAVFVAPLSKIDAFEVSRNLTGTIQSLVCSKYHAFLGVAGPYDNHVHIIPHSSS